MSGRFIFPLQKVLDIRTHQEDQKAIELGQARHALYQEEQKLDHLRIKKSNTLQQSDQDLQQTVRLQQLQVLGTYLDQLNRQIKTKTEEIEQKSRIVEEKRIDLMKASKEKKKVEKLKERQKESYKKETSKRETKIIDEVALRTRKNSN